MTNELKYFQALALIAKGFDDSACIIKNAEKDYGLEPIEVLGMAYDNIKEVARKAIYKNRPPKAALGKEG